MVNSLQVELHNITAVTKYKTKTTVTAFICEKCMKAGNYLHNFQRFSFLVLLQYNEHILWKRLCHMIEWNPLGLYFHIAASIPVIFHWWMFLYCRSWYQCVLNEMYRDITIVSFSYLELNWQYPRPTYFYIVYVISSCCHLLHWTHTCTRSILLSTTFQ